MLNTMTVTNHLNESMTIDLRNPEQSGFAVLYIGGLGPAKSNISLTERAGIDGSLYNSARVEYRNIVIGFRFMPDVETNRQKSYKYFPIKRQIRLDFETANRNAYAYGYVESNEPDIFSKEEGCSISILCPESYLLDIDEQINIFGSVSPQFEFPFSNESLVTPLLIMSELEIETEKNIYYEGDAPTGMVIYIHATGAASEVVITNEKTLGTIAIDSTDLIAITGADITAGDDIYISTIVGDKYATLIRSGVPYNILNCLGTNPEWFLLERGDNLYAYDADSGLSNLQFEFRNPVAYEGI